ncbi:vacuolar membrane-associated protein iml1, partial [Coemansia biformis]
AGRARTHAGKPGGGRAPYNQSSGHRGSHADDGGQSGPTLFNRVSILRVHDDALSSSDLVLNPTFFPGVCVGDTVAIKPVFEGDGREAVSPRGSLDGDPAAAAAAATSASATASASATTVPASSAPPATADMAAGHAGDSSSSGKSKGHPTSISKPSALAPSVGQSTGPSEDSSEAPDGADRGRRVGSQAGGDSPFRSSRPQGPASPGVPNRWASGPGADAGPARGSDKAGGARDEDGDSDGGLEPDPHREILLRVGELRRDTQQIQASISSHAAHALWGEYLSIQRVAVRKIDLENKDEREAIRADFIEIAFRDQYVGRSDMWRLWRNLSQRVVHKNKPTNMEGLIRASVRRIYKANKEVACGFIDASTQPIFRSESGRFIVLLQMSEEMWSYHEDGHLCFEKAVNGFLAELFKRWNEGQLNHMVTIVMFSRWYYHETDSLFFQDLSYDEENHRYFRDYYKVIADMEVRPDWSVFLPDLLAEFNTYRRDIQELSTSAGHRLRGDLSKASQGNILEAINLGLNSFASNYVDRDLARTGLSTIVVTPSFGVFDVPKKLLRMTTERMLLFGLRVDLVCLAPRPLFRPPVFRFKSYPVPTEQEQLRAVIHKHQAEREAKRAENELNSASPLAESPGTHPNAAPFGHGAGALKDRSAKVIAAFKPDPESAVDPISLDSLYFDDERWENELLPHLTGIAPRTGRDSWISKWQAAGAAGSRASKAELDALRRKQRQVASSIASMFVGSMPDLDLSEIPDTILDLHKADHPFFAGSKRVPQSESRVFYYYFAYWVDSGFYNFSDDRRSHHLGDFVPTCKMGELSMVGVDNYMRCAPLIPNLELRAGDYEYPSLPGGDAYAGSASGGSVEDPYRGRGGGGWPLEAQLTALATDVTHGKILRSDQLSPVEGHEQLLAMFAKFDSQAIVGTGAAHPNGLVSNEGLGSGSLGTTGLGQQSAANEHKIPFGHMPTPQHLVQNIVPSNVSVHWEDGQSHQTRRPAESRPAAERTDTGPSGSVEHPDQLHHTAASSASPSLCHSQAIKPAARPEHDEATSSSLPRDVRLGGGHQPSTTAQRTSIFARTNQQARRARQMRQPSGSARPGMSLDPSDTGLADKRLVASGPSPPHEPHPQAVGGARISGSIPDAVPRHSIHRFSESPYGLECSRSSIDTTQRAAGESMATHASSSERMPVSESIIRHSHLDDHVQTFRGYAGHDMPPMQNVQSPNAVSVTTQIALAAQKFHAPGAGGIGQAGDFQLTLPPGRQAVPRAGDSAPGQPGAPHVPEYHSGSPQYGKAIWPSDRLVAGLASDPSIRTPRGRHCGPYNPCNTDRHPLPHNELSQRWAFAFATHASLSSFTPKWRSLCTPASLPLVTNFLPSDLHSCYHHFQYHLPAPNISIDELAGLRPEDYDEFSQFVTYRGMSTGHSGRPRPQQQLDWPTRLMLKELVYQRLAQGFQFINVNDLPVARGSRDPSARLGYGSGWPALSSRSDSREWSAGRSAGELHASSVPQFASALPLGSIKKQERAIFLSNGRQIQKLEFQDSSDSAGTAGVSVTRWERNRPFDMLPLNYRFQMWSRISNLGYSSTDTRFSYSSDDEVNWNSLDRLMAGHHKDLNQSMKYWRTRYVLIPVDQLGGDAIVNTKSNPFLSVEDIRIANFEKFLDHVLRLLRKDSRETLEKRFLGMLPAEMRRSAYAGDGPAGEAMQRAANSSTSGSQQQQQQQQQQSSQQQSQQPSQQQQQQQSTALLAPVHFVSSNDSRKTIGLNDLMPSSLLQIRYTTMYPVTYINNQLNSHMHDGIYLDPSLPIALPPPATSALGLSDHLNAESPIAHLAFALQHPTAGLSLRNIRWHYGYFRLVFCGFQLVDWILVNFGGVNRRSQAALAGARLMERGILRSPHRAAVFMDGYHFYELTESCLRFKTQSLPQGSRSQHTLVSTIGLADMVSRYGTSSNNASPTVSRPESRQGSHAPSLVNDGEQLPSSTSAAAGAASTPRIGTLVGAEAKMPATPVPTAPRDAAAGQAAADAAGGNPQPASKLRVRTDVQPSALQSSGSTLPQAGQAGEGLGVADGGREQGQSTGPRPSPGQSADSAGQEKGETNPARQEGLPSQAGLSPVYERTPDVFPELARRTSKRTLPKNLTQTRMFALDLDQQHKSTRIEQCLVHLDAVHNPMSCFHLSINWLNCTNFLIEEMVRGWAQMAERCGMRLVEAPRAQDTSSEHNHPFHSPIKISLELQPPPAKRIFDDKWVAEFAHLGDDDSEPESGLGSDDQDAAGDAEHSAEARRRARTLRRLVRCIPTYPFERELLEEQHFVLDVEADSSYPKDSLLARDFSFERAEHKYTQYVHRSGTAFVQICGPGQFLWINNYLYASHQSHARPPAAAPSAAQLASGGVAAAAAAAAAAAEAALATSTPSSGRQLGRSAHSGTSTRGTGQDSDGYAAAGLSASGAAARRSTMPVYYPVRHVREVWPHQQVKTFTRHRTPDRQLEIPEEYSLQIVNELGRLPEDFDSVNAAVTRMAIMRRAMGQTGKGGRGDGRDTKVLLPDSRMRRGSMALSMAPSEGASDWDDGPAAMPDALQGDPAPDALRATFLEICKDKNSLEMFWQHTIQRYRSGWRTLRATQGPTNESPKSRPMVVDMFTDAIWQSRKATPPTT